MGEVSRIFLAVTLLLGLLLSGCDDDDDVCSDLAGALASASDGDLVRLGECRVEGAFTIPPGVTLSGAGTDVSTIVAPLGGVALTLSAGAQVTDLSVETAGLGGIHAQLDEGRVRIEDVEVRANMGWGIRLQGGAEHGLTRVNLLGPVTPENATDIPVSPEPTETATHGLVVTGSMGAGAILNDVSISGFARFGALFLDSTIVWNTGTLNENLTAGLMARGGMFAASNVTIRGTLEGIQPLPAYGAIFAGGARAGTTGLVLEDNEGLGILHDDSEGVHEALTATNNGDAAVWAQQSPLLEIHGDSMLAGNRLAGVVLVDTPASIRESEISTSALATRITPMGDIAVGDGIHAMLTDTMGVTVESVTLTGNERAGVILDIDGPTIPAGVIMDVTVDGSGAQLGVVGQGTAGLIASGEWDASVTRLGDTAANDAALSAVLEMFGLIAPMFLPPPME